MKKRRLLILCLWTLLFLNTIALAEGTEAAGFFVADPNGETEDFIIATAALDGRLYMLSHQRLYEYAPDQPDVVILLYWGSIMATLNHGQSRETWLEDFARTRVNALIQGEDAVYGVNHRYGTLFRLDGGDLSPWGRSIRPSPGWRTASGSCSWPGSICTTPRTPTMRTRTCWWTTT